MTTELQLAASRVTKNIGFYRILRFSFLVLVLWHSLAGVAVAQTPGMIIKPALSPGNTVLDPDGDGYVSQKTNGIQLGFTIPPNNDVTQSELPYVAIIRPDPLSDLLRGPTGSFSEIVGIDASGNNAILTFNDGTNLFIRFRLGGFAPNSKSYSLMIDTDGKIGFTGPNADPNAITGNPGFEAEIVLETNFNVKAYNVNGTTSGTLVSSYSYDTNCQKSMAVSTAEGDPDYFYDFYLPLSSLSTLFTGTTPLRIVATTTMNPHPAIGNNAVSDIGGVTTGSNLDDIFEKLIEEQTPTPPGTEVLDRSACPTISAVGTASTTISGTSTEASGTSISVKVYQSDGATLIGSGTTTTSGTAWTINISAFSPAVTLAAGQIVKATATATGKGTSEDNCSTKTVTSCAGTTSTSGVTLTKISGGKGYTIANSFPAGTIFTWYNADYTVAVYPDKNGSLVNIPNPVTSTTASQLISYATQQGQTFPSSVFYFTFQEPGKCVSSYLSDCQYSSALASGVPVITTSLITTATTSISGTCVSSTGTRISLYANGIFLTSTTVASTTNWTISGLNLTDYSCQTITATACEAGKCPSAASTGVAVSHAGLKPSINSTGCSSSNPVTSLSGFSNDADGTVITLYRTSPLPRTAVGTATVASGVWTVSSLTLVSGNVVVAAATSGGCISPGPDSEPVTISTQTSLTPYTIAITSPTEGQSSVGGTISGGTYPVTLKLYIDQSQIGSDITVSAAGAWSVGSLLSTDLYIGGTLNITLTAASSCESVLSTASATVQCLQPALPTYVGESFAYCVGGAGQVTLSTSESMVIYQLVDGTGTAVGPSTVGTGGSISLFTNALNANLGPVYVKAFKLANPACGVTATTAINFNSPSPSPTVTFSTTALSVARGTTTVNLPFTAKSTSPSADTYTISYTISSKAQGFLDVNSPTPIPGSGNIALVVPSNPALGTYNGTLTVANSSGATCTTSYGFSITVYSAASPPIISAQPYNTTICSGSTTTLSVTASNATGYQWQSSATYGGTYANISLATSATYTTPALTSTSYYRVVVTNANPAPNGSVTSNIATVTVTATPTAGAITGSGTVCAGQSAVPYSITAVSGATSYTWSYSGSNTTISGGTTTAASLTFASNATSGTLSVTANNSCGSGTAATKAITVGETPFINSITATVCNATAFTITPANSTNGIVPTGTTYSWSAPVVTGGVTGGASGSGASSISGTLTNPTSTTQTATYTVTPVKGSCTGATFTVTISVNPPILLTATPSDALCYGVSTGSVALSVSGGTPTYTYAWSASGGYTATTQNISSLAPKSYSVTVTDSKGCTATTSALVSQPSTGIGITPTITNVACNGGNTGAISIALTGGTSPYTYLWTGGSSSQNRTGLIAGSYAVTVTDASNCSFVSNIYTVTEPTAISASAAASAILCNGGSSTITVTASGGTGTLQYSLNGGSYQAGNTFSSIVASATPYSITVKDANNCTATTSVTVTQPTGLSLSTALTNASCPGVSDGAINLTVSGGTAAYTYDWADVSGTSNSEDRTLLAAGSYSVTVTDANSCTSTSSVTIANTNPNPVVPGTITKN